MVEPSPTSGSYRIVVRGRLSQHWSSALAGMAVEGENGRTTMSGEIVDQAQLFGVLEQLRDLGIELISVNPAH